MFPPWSRYGEHQVPEVPSQPLDWATVLHTGLSWHSLDQAGLLDGTGCPGVYKQSQRKGWGCAWGRKQFFLPWFQHPFLPLLSPGAEIENQGGGARGPTQTKAREKRSWGHSPLGCLREIKDVDKVSNTPKYPQVHICLHTCTHQEPHTNIRIRNQTHSSVDQMLP